MAKTEDKTNKLYGTGSGENNVTPITENKINIGNKLATLNPNDPTQLIDAFNIDWASGQYSYDGNPNHIIQSTGHLIEVINSKATTSSFDDFTDSFTRNSQVILYNTTDSKKTYPTKIEGSIEWNDNIFVNSIGDPDITYGWRYNTKDTESNHYVWMASMTYTETFSNNAWEIGNFHDMSSYILLSGESGINGNFKSTVFVRTNSTPLAPKSGAVYDTGLPTNRSVYVRFNPDISIMGKQWSDGIPSGQEILWASTAIISAENPSAAQWTTPRQMTDTETYDVEFSPLASEYGNPTDNPNNWYDPQDTLPEGTTWEDMIWRAERTCVNGEWTTWIIVKIKGERGYAGKPADYYEQRWTITDNIETPDTPLNAEIGVDNNTDWKLTPQYESGKITWLTSRKVIYYGNPGEYEAIYDGEWSTPMRMNGIDGVSNPIQPVLKYYWHTDYSTAPSYNASEQNPNVNDATVWAESPGNPHDSYIYLWMIQGQRHEGNMIDLDNSSAVSYWTAPVCLSGKNGEPGVDAPGIEFIYKRFTNVHEFTDDNPASWYTSSSINKPTEEWTGSGNNNSFAYVNSYLGPVEQGWTDHPQGITNTYKYEYATYRKTHDINDESYWGVFNTPFAWSVYGENGLDGDGVEYIYTTTENNAKPSQTYIPTATEFNASQIQSEWGVGQSNGNSSENGDTIWHDDPQQVNNAYQKYQWVSTRKYKIITDDNYTYLLSSNPKMLSQWFVSYDLIDTEKILWATKITGRPPQNIETTKEPLNDKNGQQLKIGDKAWFPYSTPELWNWYVNDGTNADRIVMLYMRNSSINNSPDTPPNNQYTIAKYSYLGWAESPGNKTDYSNNDETTYAYLWMTSNYYSEKIISENDTIYTLSDEWSAPVCLTGETGQEGEDGTDIEFIYFRTGDDNKVPTVPDSENFAPGQYNESDWPFVNLKRTHDEITNSTVYDSAITKDGIKYLINDNKYDILEDETIYNSYYGDFTQIPSDVLHDVWTDNPLGVSSTYDYEYAAVRRKSAGNDSQWGDFCKPFLWSKYGEAGVDGDGVEYIYYLSSDENEVTFDALLETDYNNSSNNPANWSISQDPEHILNGWSDDPKGISEEKRWEYVSVRHKRFNTESNTTMWGKYSEPKVWSHFAVDGLAINLVLESDNDMMAVSIDENDVVTASVASQATFRLDHNTRIVDTSYYSMYINNSNIQNEVIGFDSEYSYSYLKVNVNNNLKTFAKLQLVNNSAYVLSTTIPEGFDMTEIENELRITSYAVITDNSFDNSGNIEIDTQRIFTNKVNGLHLSIDDIYQLQLSRNVVKKDSQGNLETIDIRLKSLTSNDVIDDARDAAEKHLFAYYSYNGNTEDKITGNYNSYYNSYTLSTEDTAQHKFILKYINGSENTVLDEEYVSVVWDGENGNPGVDSKSQEYIYFLCDELDKTFTDGENPVSWSTNQNYQTDDYPFIGTDGTNVLNNDWTDHPQGIDETHRYEYISTRSYDTSTETWGEFSEPVIWANWGHTGEDGDGVEYIYFIGDNADWRTALYNKGDIAANKDYYRFVDPRRWIVSDIASSSFLIPKNNIQNFQQSEFIPNENGIIGGMVGNTDYSLTQPWHDNPITNLPVGQYQFVSIRKYKTFTQELYEEWFGTPSSTSEKWKDIFGVTSNDSQWNINTISGYFSNGSFSYIGKKIWLPYSEPVIWSSNIQGIPGAPGGSGLTIDFDNPSMQIAVNSTGYIKDNQTVTTYLNLYEGTQHINNQYVTLSINDGPNAFTHSYVSSDKFGYTLHNSDNYTYYTWTIGNIDINDDGTIGSNESSQYYDKLKLENNAQLSFNISYNSNNYTKNINLVPIQYGKDGADAETFELYCAYSTIHYNRMLDMPALEPSSVQYKIKHTSKNGVDFITPNSNNFTISYEFIYDNDNAIGKGDGIGRTPSSSNTNNDGIINIPSDTLNTLTQVNVQLKHGSNVWDEDILEVVYDGVNGVDGDGTEYIYYRSQEPVEWVTYVSGNNDDNNVNPSYWTPNGTNGNIGESDYIPASYKNILWFDHPQGVDSSYVWEYVSQRQYNGLKNTWERYTSPIAWSHYGETGRDGDGVEYIYKRTDTPISGDGQIPTPSAENWYYYQTIPEYGKNQNDWKDNPSGVNSTYIYEYVSVRKYKELTDVNKTEFDGTSWDTQTGGFDEFIESYIGKNVWFPYSTPKLWSKYGRDGQASAVTMDNDNENIAVIINNNNNVVRTVSDVTYFNMYDNLNEVQFSLTAPVGFTYSNSGAASTYWSSENSYYVNFGFAANQNIPNGRITYSFTGNYVKNGTSYSRTSNVSIIGIKEADVPTLYQLRPTAKVVKWNGITNNSYVPDVIYSYVSYIENGENQIITSYSANKFGREKLRLFYNDVELSGNFIPGTELGYFIKNKANTLPLKIDLKYGPNNILLDSETITLVSDGKKGDDGDPGADAITLDFTNDQINLAVDGDGYIKPNQEKTTYLVIYPSNVEIDNIEISYDTNKINVINGNNSNSGKINLTYSKDTNIAKYTININILSGINVQIPENGLNIEFDISLNDGSELWKTLKICGQHNGENAVTYELNPDYNIIKHDGTKFKPKSRFGISLIKYDGENISTLSYNDWHNSMLVSYYFDNDTTNTQTYNGTNISLIDNVNDSLSIRLHNGTDIEDDIIDTETIPIVYDGEKGSQGFTGPVVRMRGEYVHNSNTQYGNGEYNRSTNGNQYNGTSPLYIDIVTYTNNNGTKYYTPKTNVSGSYMATDSSYLCKGSYFVSNTYPTTPSDSLNGKWVEATQFDFIATKLLYADQALINQISTHDLIATDSNGNPVAGVTSGKKMYGKGGSSDEIYSVLNSQSGSGWNHTITNSDENDPSNVRIFAGKIWNNNNSYSLTNAPFNVRQDGTTYMTKARISGDAIIEGDITADTLKLQQTTSHYNGSFTYFDSQTSEFYLPNLEKNTTQMYFVLCRNGNTNTSYQIKLPYYSPTRDRFQYSENSRITVKSDRKFKPENNTLYQLVGTYVSTENYPTWSVIETPLAPISSGDTIYNPKYYDVTADVTLIGYNYSNGGWYDMSTSELSVPKIQYGSDNGNNYVSIDFYTYLSMDESLVNKNNGNNYIAYADLGKIFGWFS